MKNDCFEIHEKDKKPKKVVKAKTVSLWAKVIGGLIIIIGHGLMWLNILPNAQSSDICACGFSIMGIFSTIDLNILADKFTMR